MITRAYKWKCRGEAAETSRNTLEQQSSGEIKLENPDFLRRDLRNDANIHISA